MRVDLRLAVPAAACWIVCGILIGFPGQASWCAAALWVGAAAALAVVLRGPRAGGPRAGRARAGRARAGGPRAGRARAGRVRGCLAGGGRATSVACVTLAAAALAATTVAILSPVHRPAAVLQATGGGRAVEAIVRVESAPQLVSTPGLGGAASASERFRGQMTSVRTGQSGLALSTPVLVFVPKADGAGHNQRIEIGDSVRVRGTLKPLTPEDSTSFLLFGSGTPTIVAEAPYWLAWANDLRSGFSRAATSLPGDGGTLLPGLAIGDVSAVGPDLDAAMKASALSHLTAVSGANCAVVIALVMFAGGALGLRRRTRVILALAMLAGFVVLVTPGPSVLRAAVMAVIIVFSAAAGRPGRGVPALALAVIVLLLFDPWLARDYGFALSVLATGGLLVLAGPLARALARWMPTSLAAVISIPLAAQLACQPVLILLNPAVPLYGVAANLLAEPAAPVATMLGLIACVLLPWLPGVGQACAQLAWVPSAWIASVATAASGFPAGQLPWLGGIAGLVLMAVLTVSVLVLVLRPPGRRRGPAITALTALVVVFFGAYGGTLIGSGVGRQLVMPSTWQIGACDIGQGDAVIVRDGDLHALVDLGPDPKLLTACLNRLGIQRIDLLVMTHFDLDHMGGLDAVLGRVGIALVGPPENAQDQARLAALERGGADVRIASSGDHGTMGGLRWDILWPKTGSTVMQTGNDGCVTIAFDGAGIRSVFLCDLGEESQNALLATNRVRPVDVVKVAHHGSADQSERMYQRLGARLGVISVGAENRYGHPTARALGILAGVGTLALRTDRAGIILIGAVAGKPGDLSVWTEKAPATPAVRE
ncbi:MAG: competence protein ComEC [Microbacteriaceae bacterium]|nr:competence protein ComEC [Microbacteriaceae bacterium]